MLNLERRRSAMSYILRPFIPHLAPASRLLAPSANKLITSLNLSHCTQPRHILDFHSDEGRANVRGWYKHQGRHTRFTLLEYRKVKEGQVRHEFIVIWLNNTTLCRFDRRARDGGRGYVLYDEGTPAEDSVHVLSSFETEYDELLEQTDVLLSIKLPHGEDLRVILAVCQGIQTHAKAAAYNLMRYNCYFFSWMIIAAVARRTYDWETVFLSLDGWIEIIQTCLPRFTEPQPMPQPNPQQAGTVAWVLRVISGVRLRGQPLQWNKTDSSSSPAISHYLTAFQDQLVLEATYSEWHTAIRVALSKLLLRSQLGSALQRELDRIKKDLLLSSTCAMTERMVLDKCQTVARVSSGYPFGHYHQDRFSPSGFTFRLQQFNRASRATAYILSTKNAVDGEPTNDFWRDTWIQAWGKYEPFEPPRDWQYKTYHTLAFDPTKFYTYSPTLQDERTYLSWEDFTGLIANEWKHSWDGCEKLVAQYDATIALAIVTTIQKRLTDVSPEQLVLGGSRSKATNLHATGNGLDNSEVPFSLQEFIRSRMQDHFEMVDRFGFGSFQELITTAEEAMCEIWVASLEVIESGRYPQ